MLKLWTVFKAFIHLASQFFLEASCNGRLYYKDLCNSL